VNAKGPAGRVAVIGDRSLGGVELCHALSRATDEWLRDVFAAAVDGAKGRFALVALGGYGRGELAPHSDIDALLLHEKASSVDAVASRLWYPVWDAGLKLGHAVRTVSQAVGLARDDLETATALLTARVVAGDERLVAELAQDVDKLWVSRASHWLGVLRARVAERQSQAGEVAFLLEPNLKDGAGGLRDVQSLHWALRARPVLGADDQTALGEAYADLMRARVALHRCLARPGEVLHLEDQDAVAAMGGYRDSDQLMAAVAHAARRVDWIRDEAWQRIDEQFLQPGSCPPDRAVATGVWLRRGEIHLEESTSLRDDPTLAIRVAGAAARLRTRIDRGSLDRLGVESTPWSEPWPVGAVDDLVALLLEAHAAIPVLEALDQRGILVDMIPEWEPNRCRPQRNAYHRFTVDRHLWEAAANAATLAHRVRRPDLLVLGALLHDIGKGYPGDHTEVGIELVKVIGPRMGLPAADTDVLVALVRHHLLLPDVATRRDLTDAGTIASVAAAVGSVGTLELLHALTEADSLATGPSAWGPWKAELVEELVERVRHVLGGGDVDEAGWRLFPTPDVAALMGAGDVATVFDGDRITVVAPDRPGLFSSVAGVLSLHGLDVLSAEAHSDEQGMAANQFRIAMPKHGFDWERVQETLRHALAGRLALEARLAEKARTYRRRRRQAAHVAGPSVRIDNDTSYRATVLEVRGPNRIGVLHRITKALAEMSLDIRHAKIQTLGDEVVDTFYVRTPEGTKVDDPFYTDEVRRAMLHAVS
jgi:[protein-PII] uridylyltransferase